MIYLNSIKILKVNNDSTLTELSVIRDYLAFSNSDKLQEFEVEIIKLWKKIFDLGDIIIQHGKVSFYGDEL